MIILGKLKIWNIDLADSYPDLTEAERLALRFLVKNGGDKSIRKIASILGITEYRLRKAMNSLADDKHIVRKVGRGKATKYILEILDNSFAENNKVLYSLSNKVVFQSNENKDLIISIGYYTTNKKEHCYYSKGSKIRLSS